MADIEFTKPHSLTIDTIKAIIDKSIPAYGEKYSATCVWETPECLSFSSAKGVTGKALVEADKITVEANVSGFFLRALTPLIRSGMESEIETLLTPPPT